MELLTDFFIASAHAQSAGAGGQGSGGFLFIMIGMFVLMYFMMIRPQMKRQKEHREMVGGLKKGDEVVTNGGLLGRIVDVGDAFITLEVAEGTEVKVQRQAVGTVLPKGTIKSI